MAASSPEEVNPTLIDALNRGDVDACVELYESDAAFVTQEGTVFGHDAIRAVMEAFISMKPSLTMECIEPVRSGDTALTRGTWKLTGTGPEGEPIEMGGRSAEIVRLQADGTWRFVVDDPNGRDD
jgi:uncharacterized protein (TIGR02246 family)